MNFVKKLSLKPGSEVLFSVFLFLVLSIPTYITGCGDQISLPSMSHLNEFEDAGPTQLTVDESRLVRARIGSGPYQVAPNEVLELTMPTILRIVTAEESVDVGASAPFICRIDDKGSIILPVVGEIAVGGKTLSEIESLVIKAYYPEYAVTRPSVFVKVLEYDTALVSISGVVQRPGVYSLRRDQMSLVALLMEAGGIVESGAALIRISHRENDIFSSSRKKADGISGKLIQQELKSLSPSVKTEPSQFSALDINSNEIVVTLSFILPSNAGTKGTLIVTYNNKILLREYIDICSEVERLISLELLSERQMYIPTVYVEEKLSVLAELLKPGSGVKKSKVKIPSAVGIESSRFRIMETNDWTVDRQYVTQAANFATTDIKHGLSPAERIQPDFGVRTAGQNTLNEGGYSGTEFKANFIIQQQTPHPAFVGETTQKSNIQNNVNMPGQVKSVQTQDSESFVLPIKGLNIPFADVSLQDGDRVIVERLQMPLFTVIGLVNKPGNFEYPPDSKYNLMQALAFAGGLDPIAEPRYVTIYRLKSDKAIVSAVFKLIDTVRGPSITEALNVRIKQGDIVSVEHTPRTRSKLFLEKLIRINIGAYYNLNDAWKNN